MRYIDEDRVINRELPSQHENDLKLYDFEESETEETNEKLAQTIKKRSQDYFKRYNPQQS